MFQGSSQRVRVPDRVSLLAVILPLVLALGLMLLGVPGARATQIVVHGQLSLYGGPGDAFSVLATVAAGAKVEILWCNAEASWCLVQNGAAEGWTPRDTLTIKKGGSADGTHAPSSVLASDSPLNGAAGASIVGTSPPGGSPQPAAPAGGGIEAAGNAAGVGGASGTVSAGVAAGGAKLGASVH